MRPVVIDADHVEGRGVAVRENRRGAPAVAQADLRGSREQVVPREEIAREDDERMWDALHMGRRLWEGSR